MDFLEVENYRAFKSRERLDISSLTLLLGKNGDGKSSLIRFFPLLKQSFEQKPTGPFLWSGEYVDFGDFQNVISKESTGNLITFKVGLNVSPYVRRFYRRRFYARRLNEFPEELRKIILSLEIGFSEKIGTYTKKAKIEFEQLKSAIEISYTNTGNISKVIVNSLDMTSYVNQSYTRLITNHRLIKPIILKEQRNERFEFRTLLDEKLIEIIRKYIRQTTKEETIFLMINDLQYSEEDIVKNLKKATNGKYWNNSIDSMSHEDRNLISASVLLSSLPTLVGSVDEYFKSLSNSICYIAPVRANVSRFYRRQELAVDSIDPHGINVPMFISSLSEEELTRFQDWTYQTLGIEIYSKKNGAHLELMLFDRKNNQEVNLADTGFGYSQILPVFTQLWLVLQKKDSDPEVPVIIAIEQPELHLHPEAQAKLAKLFISTLKNAKMKKIDLKFIIETHSEALVEQIGREVMDQQLDHKNVSLNIVSKKEGSSIIEKSFYDKNGILVKWPLGFFGY